MFGEHSSIFILGIIILVIVSGRTLAKLAELEVYENRRIGIDFLPTVGNDDTAKIVRSRDIRETTGKEILGDDEERHGPDGIIVAPCPKGMRSDAKGECRQDLD